MKFREGSSQLIILLTLAMVLLVAAANVSTTQNFKASNQTILGEDTQSEEQKKEEEAAKEAEEQAKEDQDEDEKQDAEEQKETSEKETDEKDSSGTSSVSTKSKTEKVTETGLKVKSESEDDKQESEIETADGQKIKTKIEDDGTTKIEVENGTIKLKYRLENGRTVVKVENEDGEEVELEEDEIERLENEVEAELEDDDVELVPTSGDQLAITKNQFAALTDFPVSINVETRELIIATPNGPKVVAVLPDEAVQNLLATGIISSVDPSPSDIATQEPSESWKGVVKIEIRDDEIVYRVDGKKTHRILGLLPVTTPVTAFVSSDTGLTIARQQSVLANIVDFLSP